ncbi:MAG: hypothetical protein WCK51_00410 [Armatimonadota bacterium]
MSLITLAVIANELTRPQPAILSQQFNPPPHAIFNMKFRPSLDVLKLSPNKATGNNANPLPRAPRQPLRKFKHMFVSVLSGGDDLRDGGSASLFFEFEDGSRAAAPLAVPGVPLAGNTMLAWHWDIPDWLEVGRIKHIGITTQLHKGDGQLLKPDKWRIGRVQVLASETLQGGYAKEELLFDDTVNYEFTTANAFDEWKSGEVMTFKDEQFTRTNRLCATVTSSSLFRNTQGNAAGDWDDTANWQFYVDLADGRRIETPWRAAQRLSSSGVPRGMTESKETYALNQFAPFNANGRRELNLYLEVPGVNRTEIRRYGINCGVNTGDGLRVNRADMAQLRVSAVEGDRLTREWGCWTPGAKFSGNATRWSTPSLTPLVLPKDIPASLGFEITAGPDDLRDDSTLELITILKPKDMWSQPEKVVQVVNWGKGVDRPGLTGLWRGSSVPANSTLRFGWIAPVPVPTVESNLTPFISRIMALGIGIRPGPGGGTWNPDSFTLRGLRFYYSDGKDLREICTNQNLNVTLDQTNPIIMLDAPQFQFGNPINFLPRLPLKVKGGG